MNCSKCGAKLEADAVFCTSCGTKVEQPKKICPKCGAAVKEDSLYCESCGEKFGEQQTVKTDAKVEKISVKSVSIKSVLKTVVGLAVLVGVVVAVGIYMKLNSSDALYKKGVLCHAAKNYTEAKDFFEKAAGKGNADAMYKIGYMYGHGEGVAANRQEAETWFRKAEKAYLRKIEKGDHKAIGDLCLNLYVISEADYGNEDVVVLKPDDAVFNKLGEQYIAYLNDEISKENPDAIKMLGDMYSSYGTDWEVGIFLGFVEDIDKLNNSNNSWEYCQSQATQLYQKALSIYRKRAESGDADAMYNLGVMYYNGEAVEENRTEAMGWINKAAEKDNIKAKCFLQR